MELEKISIQRISRSPLICQICGDVARGFNFDVITCMSCKGFFRRNALRLSKMRHCRGKNCCDITKETRRSCPACRLKKCFARGMDPLLIRSLNQCEIGLYTFKQSIITDYKQHQLPQPRPLNLLIKDSSNLTSNQWNLLSNIIQSYDEQNMINKVKYLLQQQSSLPPKLRLKPADTLNLMSLSLLGIQPLVERSPHFHNLSQHAQQALILHNVYFTGSLSGYFIARETSAFTNMTYMTTTSLLYVSDYMMKCARDNERLETNGNLIKLMLFILIFSSNCSIVVFNDQEDTKMISSSLELVRIQDIYVTLLWKYLVYLYGYNEAAMRFSLLVKSVIDMLARASELIQNQNYNVLIDRIVTETERSLIITN